MTPQMALAAAQQSAKRLASHMVFTDDEHQTRVEDFLCDCVLMCKVKGVDDRTIEPGLERTLWEVAKALKPPSRRIAVNKSLVVP